MPGRVLAVAGTPVRRLSKMPIIVNFPDRWRADVPGKKKIDLSKYMPINCMQCGGRKYRERLRPQKLHLIEMGKVQEHLSQK